MTGSGRLRRRRLRALLAVLIVALPLTVYAWGRGSPAFAVQRIELSGARRVSAASAAETLRAHFLGHNLFTVHASDVAAALRSFPYFDNVEIDRDFPGTLRVRILEYRPAAVLFSRGRWYVVSREGRVLLRLRGVVPRPEPTAGVAETGTQAASSVASGAAGSDAAASSAVAGTSQGAADGGSSTPAAGATSPAGTSGGAGTPAASAGTADGSAGASETAVSISSASLAAPFRTPSLFHGDLTAATLSAVTVPPQANRLPVLLTRSAVKVGATVSDHSVQDALAVLAALPPALRAQARFVSADPAGVLVVLRNGVTFAFGDAHDLGSKVLALQAVLAAYRRHHLSATWIDVSVPNRPLGTPVIVSRPAPLQTGRPTPRPSASSSVSGSPDATLTPPATGSSSPSPKASTASAPPRPKTTATPRPSASAKPTPTRSAGGAAG